MANLNKKVQNGLKTEQESDEKLEMMHKIKEVKSNLPEILQKTIMPFDDVQEKVMVLTSTIIETGALLPKVWFNYDGRKTYPMLMIMYIAPPASGKGALFYPKQLLDSVDSQMKREREEKMNQYKNEVAAIKSQNKKTDGKLPLPELPHAPLLFVPGNVTQAALIQQLNANGSENPIIIFEQEADAYGIMAKKGEYGVGNSSVLRSLFHFEDVSQLRKTGGEYLRAKSPKGVVILSGTENQVRTIFNSNQDGLFSRFMFIAVNGNRQFRNVFEKKKESNDEYFKRLTPEFSNIWEYFKGKSIEVSFTPSQEKNILDFGKRYYAITHNFISEYADSISMRHANMITRMAVILRMLRYYEEREISTKVICKEEDVNIAIWIAEISINNSLELFKKLPGERVSSNNIKKNTLWEQLPERFKTEEGIKVAKRLDIPDRTFYRCLQSFKETGLLETISKGEHRKVSTADVAVAQ